MRLLGLVQARRAVPSACWGLCRDPGCGPALQDVPAHVQAPLFTANHGSSGGFGRLTDWWFDFFFSSISTPPSVSPTWIQGRLILPSPF